VFSVLPYGWSNWLVRSFVMSSPFPFDYNSQVLAHFEGDKDLLREVAHLFLDEGAAWLEAVRAAVAARDGKAIHRTAHTLKGSVSNFLAAEEPDAANDPAYRTAAAALALERLGAENRFELVDAALAKVEAELTEFRRRLQAIIAG
jgi:HPt (histidine-containing phosphotransfer) domain-containing protein